ncbi:conserved domain protein [Acinetobacter baumannii 6014059]|uniref:Conserved domain protein n=1 Tax=Acinetobacter baumannii 6014059 TaxID=525242 RepID=A0A828SX77_ACIBA|nr:conserved domain protein [Acinetobacter baumannii 6014059]
MSLHFCKFKKVLLPIWHQFWRVITKNYAVFLSQNKFFSVFFIAFFLCIILS